MIPLSDAYAYAYAYAYDLWWLMYVTIVTILIKVNYGYHKK